MDYSELVTIYLLGQRGGFLNPEKSENFIFSSCETSASALKREFSLLHQTCREFSVSRHIFQAVSS